jgi:hypothetical protein
MLRQRVSTSVVTRARRGPAAARRRSSAPSAALTEMVTSLGSRPAVCGVGVPQIGVMIISWTRSSLMLICARTPASSAAIALARIRQAVAEDDLAAQIASPRRAIDHLALDPPAGWRRQRRG